MITAEHIRDLYRQINGDPPMAPDDVAYCRRHFRPIPDEPDFPRGTILTLIAAGYLPVPSYLLPDGDLMVHPDYLDPIRRAGGHTRLHDWFTGQWSADDRVTAEQEWRGYLSGQYVCLRRVTPQTIQRKTHLIAHIRTMIRDSTSDTPELRRALAQSVDELDHLELPFTAYDRLRFGGPTSRDIWIDQVRRVHLTAAAV